MKIGRVGIWSQELRHHADPGVIADAASELEELGYGAIFLPGGRSGDPFDVATQVLTASRGIAVATGIISIWKYDPLSVAARYREIETAHPDRFIIGVGVSHRAIVDAAAPGRYQRPVESMCAFVDHLGAAQPSVPAERVVLAALGPRMLELAAARTAGAHTYLVPPAHTRMARRVLGPGRFLAPEQAVVLNPDPESAQEQARTHLARYLALPNYVNNLRRLGFTDDDFRDGGSTALVDAIVAWGDEEAIRRRVDEHHGAGADHVCLQVLGATEGELPRTGWRRLAAALVS